jgi:predicted DsbA family dithiol-disulfide isomerase
VKVEIFSDIACPFCYIGTRNFAQALETSGKGEEVEVVWRSFQLDPSAPARSEGDLYDHLTRKFGVSRDEARAMSDRVISMGHEVDIEFDFESAFPVNTFSAHRMLQLAAETGVEAALADLFFDAYFTGSSDLSDRDDLVRLAVSAGVPE